MTDVCPAFIAAAEDSGLLHRIGGGCYVAGEQTDATTGESRYLIEYVDQDPSRSTGWLDEVAAKAVSDHPGVDCVLTRLPATEELPAPWRRALTYLRWTGGEPRPRRAEPPGLEIGRSAAADRQVVGWLADAFQAGAADLGHEVARDHALRQASALMAGEDRVSLVASLAGVPVGHATLFTSAHDDLTGLDFVELFDILVETGEHRGAVAEFLEARSVDSAQELGLPLYGNVVHGTAVDGEDPGQPIVRSLVDKGWTVTHCYWRSPARASREEEC